MRFSLGVLALLVAVGAGAQDLSGLEKILLPLDPTVLVRGGQEYAAFFGTWSDSEEIRFFPNREGEVGTTRREIPAVNIQRPEIANGAGRLLYVDTATNRVAMSLLLRHGVLNDPYAHITSVPVVRERDFLQGNTTFPQIPFFVEEKPFTLETTPVHRIKLHLYDVDLAGNLRVRIRYRNLSLGWDITQDVSLTSRNGSNASFPWYAEVPIQSLCTPRGNHFPCTSGQGILVIEPFESVADPPRFVRYWAMISMTNVRTGEVTILEP